MKQKKAWSFFQSLGKAFMYPIALLSVCGMMLGLGSGLASDDMAKLIPLLAIPVIKTILDFIVSLGLFAFVNLPVLFAIAIPLGLLKEKEDKAYGAFSGLIGFMAMHLGTNFYLKQHDLLVAADQMSTHGQTIILGIQSYNTSVLGGIIAGLLVASMYKKIVNLRIPESLGFYSGPRLVPIITLIVMSGFGGENGTGQTDDSVWSGWCRAGDVSHCSCSKQKSYQSIAYFRGAYSHYWRRQRTD